ncbi:MAG: hypothetical protein DHS20C17_07410 [Cyclobacteriaceae bacterium]|nr:MAG: hypothetical protein DHS20C17_07410 [Cyclobacteriaceae bacterium]
MIKINSSTHFWFTLCLIVSIGLIGCKNQQKLAEEEAARVKAESTAQAKSILNRILNDDGQLTLAEKERMLRQAKALKSDDPEVQQLIAQAEELLAMERDAEEPDPEPVSNDPTAEDELGTLFSQIAGSGNSSSANSLINQGLSMFSAPDTPVLIIINQSGNLKDYDEPTTIERYLHYIKDQKNSPNAVFNVVKDANGKISELELIKKSNR